MNIKFVVLFIVIAIYYVYKTWENFVFGSKYLISTIKAKKLIKDKYFNHIIDVRTNFEYNLGHYKNAINIPISEIAKKINEEFI